jgi:hypothetical protein
MYHLIHLLEISGLKEALSVDDFRRLAPLARDFRSRERITYQWRIVENFDDELSPPLERFLEFLQANREVLERYHVVGCTYWLTIIYCDQCAYELGSETLAKMAEHKLEFCLNCSSRESEDELKAIKVPVEEQAREWERFRALGP